MVATVLVHTELVYTTVSRVSGEEVKAIRHWFNLTQRQLSKRVGATRTTVSRWKRESADRVPRFRLMHLARALEGARNSSPD